MEFLTRVDAATAGKSDGPIRIIFRVVFVVVVQSFGTSGRSSVSRTTDRVHSRKLEVGDWELTPIWRRLWRPAGFLPTGSHA